MSERAKLITDQVLALEVTDFNNQAEGKPKVMFALDCM